MHNTGGANVKFFINNRSGVPIYKQLEHQIERGVVGKLLKPGDRLPTVRELALELTVNPNTVARAYRELETRGIISSVQGRGTFIAENISSSMLEEKELIIKKMLTDLVREARQLEVDSEALEELFNEVMEDWKRGGINGE